MKTYQDMLESRNIVDFVKSAIQDHKNSADYKYAVDADKYARGKNVAIAKYKKLLYTLSGRAVPDNYSANHKCSTNIFQRLIRQQTSYQLSNGVFFENENTKTAIDENFDAKIYNACKTALTESVSFCFVNYDTIQYFGLSEFVPIYDEETGVLMAGIRFWQLADDKPLRATLFEIDGKTELRYHSGKSEIIAEKEAYVKTLGVFENGNSILYGGENYSALPIIPLYTSELKQSELVPIKSQIDAFDLIKSGFANDLDDASMIYWTIDNAGGMDDIDLAKFVQHMKTVKAAVIDGDAGAKAEAHTIEVPYQSRETYLNRLEKDIIKDYGGLDVELLQAGNTTATQIKAAYEAIEQKCDEMEFCLITHILAILSLKGIQDYPTFKRSRISNDTEQTQMVLQSSSVLDTETILRKLPFITDTEVPEILERLNKEEINLSVVGDDDDAIIG